MSHGPPTCLRPISARAIECGIPLPDIQSYIDSFKLGAPPHGGAGEAVVPGVHGGLGASSHKGCTEPPAGTLCLQPLPLPLRRTGVRVRLWTLGAGHGHGRDMLGPPKATRAPGFRLLCFLGPPRTRDACRCHGSLTPGPRASGALSIPPDTRCLHHYSAHIAVALSSLPQAWASSAWPCSTARWATSARRPCSRAIPSASRPRGVWVQGVEGLQRATPQGGSEL